MIMMRRRVGLFLILVCCSMLQSNIFSQVRNLVLRIDTSEFSLRNNNVYINGERHLAFSFENDEVVAEMKLFADDRYKISRIELIENEEIEIIDSLINFNNDYFIGRIKLSNLTKSSFPALRFKFFTDSVHYRIDEVRLQPACKTTVSIYNHDIELFIGEEKSFELITRNIENLRISNEWVLGADFDYRLKKENSHLRLILVPKSLGRKSLTIKIPVFKPELIENKLVFDPVVLQANFTVKSGRLAYLSVDQKEVTFDDISRKEGIELQIDRARGMQLLKTYRIEEQEAAGGALIAELFTRENLNNDKVLCRLRVYNLHRPTDGYLYIKEGDEAKYITNFGISPKTNIDKMSLLRNGVDWAESNVVNPGEMVNLRIEGEGLQKARFMFEDLKGVVQDSIVRTDNVHEFRLNIPLDISKKKIYIYNRAENTGKFLQVREYQEPRPFDFIMVDYGTGPKAVEDFSGPELYDKTIKNIRISFKPELIDNIEKLYGKQYVEIAVKITGSRGELVELTSIPAISVCPGQKSPRNAYYDSKDCVKEEISLNNVIGQKTYDLSDWNKISLTVRHTKDKYSGQGSEKNVEIILQRRIKFDVDVSFPSLLTKIVKEEGWQNGLGVSMATIAQFSFYEKDKIARLMPYKIGVGFLALNAFNFNVNNTYRDLGIVILGSLYPTRKDTKFSFPLYMGGGYLLNKKSWFWVFGPGIRVSF